MGRGYPRLAYERQGLNGGPKIAVDAFVLGDLNLHKGCTG